MGEVDRTVLQRLRANLGDEMTAEIVRLFLDDTPSLVASIEEGTAAGDTESVGRAAHSLKATAKLLGAESLSDACADLEALARKGSRALATEVDRVVRHSSQARTALRQELAELGAN